MGREIAQINEYETALINEHDAAVFIFGNFQECIKKKESLYKNISVPVVVTGGPQIAGESLPYAFEYVPSIGRVAHRARKATEIGTLDKIVEVCGQGPGQDQDCHSQGSPHHLTATSHGCSA
ncbi:MAG: hypothetical protein MZW92_27945 [Comamonadaceae bacterium]|nr:hypothetical protein [Comamonadaceae bacterium]